MKAIVAVDQKWGIGYRGSLLQRIPEDMKFFRETTSGKVVIMGRETFESLPGKAPLKDRINIVMTKNPSFIDDRVVICRSLEELFSKIKGYEMDDVFVIGGESIYNQLLPYCNEALVTKIEDTYLSDKYFVNIDKEKTWRLVYEGETKTHDNVQYRFSEYKNTEIEKLP